VATPGAVSFNFDRKGIIQVLCKSAAEDELFLLASEAGAQDFDVADDMYVITTETNDLYKVKEALEKHNIKCEETALDMIPKVYVDCDEETSKANLALIEWLEQLDDVDAVYHNMNLPEE
jgi:transcriptional/translational regulatory protein YebC/TACO1